MIHRTSIALGLAAWAFAVSAPAANRFPIVESIDATPKFTTPAHAAVAIKLVAGDSYRSGDLLVVPADTQLVVRHASGSCGGTGPFADSRVGFALGWSQGLRRGEHPLVTAEREVYGRAHSVASQPIELFVGPGGAVRATIYRAANTTVEVHCTFTVSGYYVPLN